MTTPSSVCVYCGSSANVAESYRRAAGALGRVLAEHGVRVIYGGGRVGLMGIVADAALGAGGEVVGIIPRHIEAMEVAHTTLTELLVVDSMHERKQLMVDRSEGFVVLPGGLGTLDETFEVLTWRQLGLHQRPILVLNIDGYWDPLVRLVEHQADQGFIRPQHRGLFKVVRTVDEVLPALAAEVHGHTGPTGLTALA